MADEFEEGLKDLVSEQFKDHEPMALRDETSGKFISNEQVDDEDEREADDEAQDPADEEVNEDEPDSGVENDDEDAEEEVEDDEEEVEDKKPKGRAEKRIGQLTATVRRLERELKTDREARAAAAAAAAKPKKADGTDFKDGDEFAKHSLTTDEKAPKKPDPAKFTLGEFDPEYAEAKDDYLDERRRYLDKKREEFDTASKSAANAAPASEQDEFRTKLDTTVANGKKLFKDFDEKVVKGIEKDTWALSQTGAEFIVDSEIGADIAYHLASNTKLAKEIADLPPIKQLKRFVTLETEIQAAKKKGKRPSAAPAPIRNARGGGTRETNRFASENFDDVEKSWNESQKRGQKG